MVPIILESACNPKIGEYVGIMKKSCLCTLSAYLRKMVCEPKNGYTGYTSHVLIHLTQNIKEDYTMEKYYYNSENGLWYELQGDYYIPCLTLGEEDTQPIGRWGRKHLQYIKEYRPVVYTVLLLGGRLSGHLAEIDTRATEMYELLAMNVLWKL